MSGETEPLKQKSMHLFVEAAEEMGGLKGLVSLLLIFTGIRNDTLCHIHSNWLVHEDGNLYLRVPNRSPCFKYGTTEPCGDCAGKNKEGYRPKTEASGGRRLKIPDHWHNHYIDPDTPQSLQLRSSVEHYFKIEDDEFGYDMLDSDGISKGTVNRYVKKVADKADIGFYRDSGYTEHDELGRVPDVDPHDLRGTYCVQLMRNDANPFKAINKTGHKNVESLEPYIEFAEGEFDGDFEEEYI